MRVRFPSPAPQVEAGLRCSGPSAPRVTYSSLRIRTWHHAASCGLAAAWLRPGARAVVEPVHLYGAVPLRHTIRAWMTPALRASLRRERSATRHRSSPSKWAIRQYFSTHLLHTAALFSTSAGRIEDEHRAGPPFLPEHRAYVLSSILASEAFLEAMINELFQDAADSHGTAEDGYIAPLTAQGRARMRDVWRATSGGRALGPVDKYEMVLGLNDAPPLDHSGEPYQSAKPGCQIAERHCALRARGSVR